MFVCGSINLHTINVQSKHLNNNRSVIEIKLGVNVSQTSRSEAPQPSVAHKVTTSLDLLCTRSCIVLENTGSISWVGSLQEVKGGGGDFSFFSFPFLHPTSTPTLTPHPPPSTLCCPESQQLVCIPLS